MCTRLSEVSRFYRSIKQPELVVARTFVCGWLFMICFIIESLDDTEAFECTFTRSICFRLLELW